MLKSRRSDVVVAYLLMAPFVVVYGVLFVYPSIKMAQLSFTDAPLIGPGQWVGFRNFVRLSTDRLFSTAIWNTAYFVLLSVIPGTLLGLVVAVGVNRLKGWLQSLALAAFFLPYILPVSVVFRIWNWMFDKDYGIAQNVVALFNGGQHLSIFRTIPLFMPAVAFVTVWWLLGFNVLLFIAGLRNISSEIYEAAALDGAGRWAQFRRITWPLIWPVTVLVLTIQLILQFKIFDQVYLFSAGGRADPTMVMVQYIYKQAFQMNHGGLAAAASVVLFLIIVVFSVLQFQLLRARGER
jgi:multiple sugar transport system permease protein